MTETQTANTPSVVRLTRLFVEGFSVMDVAEDLCSFDADRPATAVAEALAGRDFDLVGVRRDGFVAGFARVADLSHGTLGDHAVPFGPDDLVTGSASLADTIRSLDINGRCFVQVLGRVAAIVTFADLEKPPVRMWLFGMVTLLDMKMTELLHTEVPEALWLPQLSAERRAATEALQAERRRMGHDVGLVECLQFGDKTRILLKERPQLRARFRSTSDAKKFFREVQQLRNNLAHGQRFIATDWRATVFLSGALHDVLAATA